MIEKFFQIEIATPQVYQSYEEVLSCSAPGALGRFQILVDHAPLVSQLGVGEVRIDRTGENLRFATGGGYIQVLGNKVLLLLDSCEAANQIDVPRAESAAGRARARLKEKGKDIDVERAKSALSRALNRLHIAGRFS
jgi:F-type H+-transporting ATPase subunit epsilon